MSTWWLMAASPPGSSAAASAVASARHLRGEKRESPIATLRIVSLMRRRFKPSRRSYLWGRRTGRNRHFAVVFSRVLFVPLFAALAAGQASAAENKPSTPAAPKPANIDRNGVLILVRSTLLALDHANKTG